MHVINTTVVIKFLLLVLRLATLFYSCSNVLGFFFFLLFISSLVQDVSLCFDEQTVSNVGQDTS